MNIETLITILTIEKLNQWQSWWPGQYSQFLWCFLAEWDAFFYIFLRWMRCIFNIRLAIYPHLDPHSHIWGSQKRRRRVETNLDRPPCTPTPTPNTYKRDKYSGMQGDLEDKGWKVFLVPYEVSSRGQILKSTKSSIITTLKHFKIKIKAEQSMFKQLSKIALLSTFSIFHAYQTKEWVSPPLLKP